MKHGYRRGLAPLRKRLTPGQRTARANKIARRAEEHQAAQLLARAAARRKGTKVAPAQA